MSKVFDKSLKLVDSKLVYINFRSKIFLQRNVVYNNRNFIPFYNVGTESEGHGRPDYGTENQTYIIDGSGDNCLEIIK